MTSLKNKKIQKATMSLTTSLCLRFAKKLVKIALEISGNPSE